MCFYQHTDDLLVLIVYVPTFFCLIPKDSNTGNQLFTDFNQVLMYFFFSESLFHVIHLYNYSIMNIVKDVISTVVKCGMILY